LPGNQPPGIAARESREWPLMGAGGLMAGSDFIYLNHRLRGDSIDPKNRGL
jgi:hypothetical protein